MKKSSYGSKEKGWSFGRGGEASTTAPGTIAQETDSLLQRSSAAAAASSFIQSRPGNNPESHFRGGQIRERRPSRSRSPTVETIMTSGNSNNAVEEYNNPHHGSTNINTVETSYTRIQEDSSRSGIASVEENSYQNSTTSRSLHSLRRSYLIGKTGREPTGSGFEHPPLLEIPEEIYAVRKAALQVLKPLTRTWVSLFWTVK